MIMTFGGLNFENHLHKGLRIEEAAGAEISNNVAIDAKAFAKMHAKNWKNAGIDKEQSPAESNEAIINSAADEEGDPANVAEGVDRSHAQISACILVFGVNDAWRIDLTKWNERENKALEKFEKLFLCGKIHSLLFTAVVDLPERNNVLHYVENSTKNRHFPSPFGKESIGMGLGRIARIINRFAHANNAKAHHKKKEIER